ncbi:MAG: tandem-95 repeat protein [Nitrosarchaeum sp.]|nr:tandem-95 repeat protein [Nitrosarchaeum sp.]
MFHANNIYVADTSNNRIQKFDSAGNYLLQFGSLGSGDGQFKSPSGIAIDSSNNIYVADTSNNRIQKFDSAGNYLLQFGSRGSNNGQFRSPSGIAIDSSNNIYVADTSNNRIQKFDSAGNYLLQFGSLGSGNGQLRSPEGITIDDYGKILVSDTGNHRIQKFDSAGNYLLQFGSLGSGDEQFRFPMGINIDDMSVYVSDSINNRIWVLHFPEEPVADDQHVQGVEDTSIAITLTASDARDDELSYTIVSDPIHGSLSGDGASVIYTPDADYFGADSFTFKANDGIFDSNIATIQIDVGNINDIPITNSQSVSTDEDNSVSIVASASDVDGDTLQFVITRDVEYGFLSGTLPNITYTPNANYFGSDSFSFKVNDGLADSNTSTVSITVNPVNDPPVTYDVAVTTNEDTPYSTLDENLQGASDVEDDVLTYSILSSTSHGVLSGEWPDIIYTPDTNYYGEDCVTFKVNDGEFDSNVSTACVTILSVNDAPVANGQSVVTDEDTPLAITLTGSDVENDPLTYEIVSQPSHGVISGTLPNVTYTPDQNYFGSDSFQFRVFDGSEYSITKKISITINPINDPPVAYSINFTTPEDIPFVNTVPVASDVEDSTLSYILVSAPLYGTLSGEPPFMTYTPDLDYFGSDSLDFKVNDGELDSNVATLYMEVGPVNDQPVTYTQSVTINEDVPIAITLEADDPDNDEITYEIVSQPSHGVISGTLPNVTYTPDQNYFGSDSFSFKANDGLADSNTSTISITINPVNDPPITSDVAITTNEDTPYHGSNEYILISSDVEDDPLTFVLLTSPSHGVLSGTLGNLTYTPDTNYYGEDCVTFKANDGEFDSNVSTACVTILSVNDAPVADSQSVVTEKDTLVYITLTSSDVEDDPLTFDIVAQPKHGTIFGLAPDLRYLPDKNFVGDDVFTFQSYDGMESSLVTSVTISVIEPASNLSSSTGSSDDTLPRFTGFEILDSTEKQGTVYRLYDPHETLPHKVVDLGDKVKIRVQIDDKEATSNILHFGMYLNIRDRTSDVSKSDAYLIYEKGKNPTIVDSQGLFESATINTVFEGRSMWMESEITFKKSMMSSDIILETWNEGRHPIYFTIPSVLEVKPPIIQSSDKNVEQVHSKPVETKTEPDKQNISGTVFVPEKPSTEPIRVFSLAGGSTTQIKNNNSVIIDNHDLSVRVEGFVKSAVRGDVVGLLVLRPDDSMHVATTVIDKSGHYVMPLKLNTKWESGMYRLLVNFNEKEVGKISFFVSDGKDDGFGGVLYMESDSVSHISDYLKRNISDAELSEKLTSIGWSKDRIDKFLMENYVPQYPAYSFVLVIFGMVSLLFVLVVVLNKK